MDRKSILVLVVSFGLLMLWYPLVNRLFPPAKVPVTAAGSSPTNVPGGAVATNAGPDAPAQRPPPSITAAPETPAFVRPTAREELLEVVSDDSRYTFSSVGGGLRSVELLKYPESVGRRSRYGLHSSDVATLNDAAPLPVFSLLGGPELQGDNAFELSNAEGVVRADKRLPSGLRVVKEFRPGSNYLMSVAVRLENTSRESMALPPQELVIGTATPISPTDVGTLVRLQWFDGGRAQQADGPWFANRSLGCLPGTPRSIYVAGSNNVFWGAVQNQFFALLTVPPSNQPAPQVIARHVDLPAPTRELLQQDRQLVAKPVGFQGAFLYPAATLGPGQVIEHRFEVFAGPKEYRTLDQLASRLGHRVDLVMDFGGFFGFFAKALLLSMNGLHALGLPYGLAIIGITVIIKLLFWPLTQASTRSMKRMQALQPKMKEIKEKYKDDPKKMNERTMAFMKEHKLNPAAGCLPILIQIPVFFGFYKMLQSAIELRGARFLWAFDLSQPDTIFVLPIFGGFPVNPLPIVMGLTQFWQMRLTPPAPGVDPVQQKMFQYMPLIFLFILYNFSSGLTLYWTVQNLLTIAQMKLTKSTGEPATPAVAAPRRKA